MIDKDNKEDFAKFLASIPSKQIPNPYWYYDEESDTINRVEDNKYYETLCGPAVFDIRHSRDLLTAVHGYFKEVYDSFRTEAQVLCIHKDDAPKLEGSYIPRLSKEYTISGIPVVVFVLPQHNTGSNTIISEKFWQTKLIDRGITPVARIHSHHILDAYQSSTDFATLNSNTLEMVIGHVNCPNIQVGYWLDVRSTSTKSNVWLATELDNNNFDLRKIPCGGK